jgi:hypothetical protein
MVLPVPSSDCSPLGSQSSSDWSPSPLQQRHNAEWGQWEINTNSHQIHNPKEKSASITSSSDWSQPSSAFRHNHRWEEWDIENQINHLSNPERDDPFGNSRPGTPSSDWSSHSLLHKWEQWEIESQDGDSGDEDYNPLQNSRLRPGPSNYRPLSKENSMEPENHIDGRIGVLPYTVNLITS